MIEITLQQTANQSFSFDIDGFSFDVVLKTADSVIADVSIDGELKISGVRAMAYRPIVPYQYLTLGSGNLFFITENGEAPDYNKFGLSQSLVYLTAVEVDFLNAY